MELDFEDGAFFSFSFCSLPMEYFSRFTQIIFLEFEIHRIISLLVLVINFTEVFAEFTGNDTCLFNVKLEKCNGIRFYIW